MKQTYLAEQVQNPTNKEFLNGMTEGIICIINSGKGNMWENLRIWTIFLEQDIFRFTVGENEPHKPVAKA